MSVKHILPWAAGAAVIYLVGRHFLAKKQAAAAVAKPAPSGGATRPGTTTKPATRPTTKPATPPATQPLTKTLGDINLPLFGNVGDLVGSFLPKQAATAPAATLGRTTNLTGGTGTTRSTGFRAL